MLTLVLGRLVQAVGAGCGTTLVRTIARDAYGPERLVKAIAYLTMFYTLGPMVSPIVGGILIDTLGWRSVFGFAVLAGAVITTGAYLAIPETRPQALAAARHGHAARAIVALFAHCGSPPCAANRVQHRHVHDRGNRRSDADEGATNRSRTEFGLYFLLFPVGFFLGNLLTTRVGNRARNRDHGAARIAAVDRGRRRSVEPAAGGYLTPLVIFLPGFFITMAQGIALPYGQAGAMATIPQLAGTAAGVGVFVQFFCGAVFAQIYGLLASGTPGPLVATTVLSAILCLIAGSVPFFLRGRRS